MQYWARTVQRSAFCRSRRELSKTCSLAKVGFHTAENRHFKVRKLGSCFRANVGAGPRGTKEGVRSVSWSFSPASSGRIPTMRSSSPTASRSPTTRARSRRRRSCSLLIAARRLAPVMSASGARTPPTTSTARWGRSRPLGGESLVETNLETRLGEMKQSLLSFRRMQAVFSQMESRAP